MECRLYKYKIILASEDCIDIKPIINYINLYHLKYNHSTKNNFEIFEIFFNDFQNIYLFLVEISHYDTITLL